MSDFLREIMDVLNGDILGFVKAVNAEYPQIPVDEMLAVWCKQQHLPISTFGIAVENGPVELRSDTEDVKICIHRYSKGQQAHKQCTRNVKGGWGFV
jgi:hypothetical protein